MTVHGEEAGQQLLLEGLAGRIAEEGGAPTSSCSFAAGLVQGIFSCISFTSWLKGLPG